MVFSKILRNKTLLTPYPVILKKLELRESKHYTPEG